MRLTRTRSFIACSLSALGIASVTWADLPTLGGPMVHLEVGFDGTALSIHKASSEHLVLRSYPGVEYDAPADVLNETMYNGQYGWMIAGTWTAPEGASLWIESLESTPGLNAHAARTSASPFAPIFGTEDSGTAILWNGMMAHNWYSTDLDGRYQAVYRVYFGDSAGNAVPGYGDSEVRLDWTTGLPCVSDFNGSGSIGVDDIFTFLSAWFATDSLADIDDNGAVDVPDIFLFLSSWFSICG